MDPMGHADKVHQQIAASGVPILQTTCQHVPPPKLLHLRTVDWPCGFFFVLKLYWYYGFDLVVCSLFLFVVNYVSSWPSSSSCCCCCWWCCWCCCCCCCCGYGVILIGFKKASACRFSEDFYAPKNGTPQWQKKTWAPQTYIFRGFYGK